MDGTGTKELISFHRDGTKRNERQHLSDGDLATQLFVVNPYRSWLVFGLLHDLGGISDTVLTQNELGEAFA